MEKKYKVLHVFSGYGGGISSLIVNLIENSKVNFKHDIMAFTYKDGDKFLERIRLCGSQSFQMPRPRVDGYGKFRKYISKVMIEGGYDVVHSHLSGFKVKPFYDAIKKAGIKSFVIHAHSTTYDSRIEALYPVRIFSQFCNNRFANEYMTCSQFAAEYMFGKKYLKKKKCALIPNGIKEEQFSSVLTDFNRCEYNTEFGINNQEKIYLHVGRFSFPKNHIFILELIRELHNMNHEFKVLMVGDGELKSQIEKQADDYGVSSHIVFTGRRSDIPLLMQYADLAILPSLHEGLPTVAVECQASGTPIMISSNVTSQCDMKLDLAYFYPIESAKLWAEKIIGGEWVKKNISECLEKVKIQDFTAKKAGYMYCNEMERIIKEYG